MTAGIIVITLARRKALSRESFTRVETKSTTSSTIVTVIEGAESSHYLYLLKLETLYFLNTNEKVVFQPRELVSPLQGLHFTATSRYNVVFIYPKEL